MANRENIFNFSNVANDIRTRFPVGFFKESLDVNSLSSLIPQYRELQDNLSKLLEANILQNVSDPIVLRALKGLQGLLDLVVNASGYSDDEFLQNRNRLIGQFDHSINQFMSEWPAFYSMMIAKELEKQKEKADVDSKAIESLKTELIGKIQEFEDRYKNVATKIETDSIKFTFGDEAEKNNKSGSKWLVPSLIFLLTLIGLIYAFWLNICLAHLCALTSGACNYCKLKEVGVEYTQSLFIFDNIRILLFKAFCLSLNIYILTFCLRQYSIQKHNYTINKHKANSLQAAIYLLEKVSDKDIAKQDIIKHAVEAIFSHQKTGYNSKDKEADLNLITTLLKNLKT